MRPALLAIVAIGILLSGPAMIAESSTASAAGIAEDAGDVDPEIPPGAGRIIGSPDAGPDPLQSGDRGGWAQLVTLGALTCGVGFIMWKIISAARQAPGSAAGD